MIRLTGLPEERFPAYRARLTREYARDKVAAGVWSPEEALSRSEADLDGLLPDGANTRDHFLYEVRDASTSEEVGVLWLAIRNPDSGRLVWIYDLEIFERFRRKGYAKRTLEAAEEEAKELGIDRVELHVFGYNAPARALYENAGYAPTSIVMAKQLGGGRGLEVPQ
jgi:RimJ/RimL family protein N-acetyltransferase